MFKKYSYLIEIPIFYFLVLVWNYLLVPEAPGFIDYEPHPFWLGIGLFALGYGVRAGLFAALLSAALYLSFAWYEVDPYLFKDPAFYVLPSLFLIVGTVMGVLTYRHRHRIEHLSVEQGRLNDEITRLQLERKTARHINAGLEKKIVTQMSSLVTLYEGARRLEPTKLDDFFHNILQFFMKTLELEEATLYVREGAGWKLKCFQGGEEYRHRPEQIQLSQGIIGLAGTQSRIVSIRDFARIRDPQGAFPDFLGECLVAGPLRKGEQGEVIAVVGIEKMSFLKFNSATINLFSLLLGWASRELGQAYLFREQQAKDILDPDYNIYSERYLHMRAAAEVARSQKYYLPLVFGWVRVEGLEAYPKEQQLKIRLEVAGLLKACCREIDVVSRSETNEVRTDFALLLITVSEAQTQEIRACILKTSRELFPEQAHITLRVGLAHFSPQNCTLTGLMKQALLELEHGLPTEQAGNN